MKTWTARFVIATLVTMLAVGSHYWLAWLYELERRPDINWSVAAIMWLVIMGISTAINSIPSDVLDKCSE